MPLDHQSHPKLQEICNNLDELLHACSGEDWPGAKNGLQVQNNGTVTRVAAAVDASLATIRKAVEAGADLLLVHHGLFWSGIEPLTGAAYEKVALCIRHNLAIYSSHLPLDAHPVHGNNALLTAALGLPLGEEFFECKGWLIGRRTTSDMRVTELLERIEAATGEVPNLVHLAREQVGRLAVISGGAGDMLRDVARAGCDTFLTGEGAHWTAALAEELGVTLIYAGHYATETFGVRSLLKFCTEKWGLPGQFIDHPSGL